MQLTIILTISNLRKTSSVYNYFICEMMKEMTEQETLYIEKLIKTVVERIKECSQVHPPECIVFNANLERILYNRVSCMFISKFDFSLLKKNQHRLCKALEAGFGKKVSYKCTLLDDFEERFRCIIEQE
jgi:hypothetical protein